MFASLYTDDRIRQCINVPHFVAVLTGSSVHRGTEKITRTDTFEPTTDNATTSPSLRLLCFHFLFLLFRFLLCLLSFFCFFFVYALRLALNLPRYTKLFLFLLPLSLSSSTFSSSSSVHFPSCRRPPPLPNLIPFLFLLLFLLRVASLFVKL